MSKGEQTRTRVLAQAAPVFNQRGFFGTSLADLMAATGLQKGGLYNHFASKEALAVDAFEYALTLIDQQVRNALVGKQTVRERLHAMIGIFRSFVENPPLPGGCPIMNTAIESDDAHPVLREHARYAMDRWQTLIRRIIAEGVQAGEVRPTVDGDTVATVLIATLEGGVMLSKLYNDNTYFHRAADHTTAYIDQFVIS